MLNRTYRQIFKGFHIVTCIIYSLCKDRSVASQKAGWFIKEVKGRRELSGKCQVNIQPPRVNFETVLFIEFGYEGKMAI